MGDFIRYFIEEMAKEVFEVTCVAMVNILKYVSGVERVDEAVSIKPHYLTFVPDNLKTQEMCNEAVQKGACTLGDVPDHSKTKDMGKRVVEENPQVLEYVPDQFKPQRMCDEAVSHDPSSFQYVPDWFVTQQQVKIWYNYDSYCNANELIKWHGRYQKPKLKKQK